MGPGLRDADANEVFLNSHNANSNGSKIFRYCIGEPDPSRGGECRTATHILTLGPASVLKSKKIVQSILDASTAPGKRESYRRVLETEISTDPMERTAQLDENPGLWMRFHSNIRSLILPDVL